MLRRTFCTLLLPAIAVAFLAGARLTAAAQSGTIVVQMVNVPANLEKTIDAKKSKAGDAVDAKTTSPVTLSNGTKVPAGSMLVGHIDSITPSENKGDSTLVLTFDKLEVKNGPEITVKAVVVRVASYASTYGDELASGSASDTGNGSAAGVGTSSGRNAEGGPAIGGLHYIKGLTLSSSPKDATSGTLTQAKKNIHLTGSTQFIISVAPAI